MTGKVHLTQFDAVAGIKPDLAGARWRRSEGAVISNQ